MEARSLIFQRVLLNYFHRDNQDPFLKSMPKEASKLILSQNVLSANPQLALISPEEKLRRIHYSWFIPLFKNIPEAMKPLIVSILPQNVALGICKYFKITYTPFSVSPIVRRFFARDLYQKVDPDFTMPIPFLPYSPLNPLADLSKQELIDVIDFLALFDLAEEMRHTVDQKNLKNLYLCLSPKKLQFLRVCMHQKVKFASASLELENWMGDCKKLSEILHRRGLYRLGTALVGQHPDLLWHINHSLDTGRASVLTKISLEHEASEAAGTIIQQVISTINFLKKKE